MKRIATIAAMLTALGGGTALAQGMPCGMGAWQSSWTGSTQPREANASRGTTPRLETRGMATRNSGSAPIAGNVQGTQRRS